MLVTRQHFPTVDTHISTRTHVHLHVEVHVSLDWILDWTNIQMWTFCLLSHGCCL